ncbi:hypothetical protein BJ912DRAFT_1093414 [Pholiota molesta]|nr:hypothetical protein BJ912DRAFT_1093414 [Pholiota molesta]
MASQKISDLYWPRMDASADALAASMDASVDASVAAASTADADFPTLLRTAINELENENEQNPPDVVLSTVGLSPAISEDEPSAPSLSRQHKRRRHNRSEEIMRHGYSPSTKSVRKHLNGARAVKTNLDTAKLPVASGAYTALNKPTPQNPREVPEIEKLIQSGFQYISCGEDGTPSRLGRPICDRNGFVIAHIAGSPQDPLYDKETHELFKIIVEESHSNAFTKSELNHKRGSFPAINFGFTLPNGFKHPLNLDYRRHQAKIDRIQKSPGFKRISAFQNGMHLPRIHASQCLLTYNPV